MEKYRVQRDGRDLGTWSNGDLKAAFDRGDLLETDVVWDRAGKRWLTIPDWFTACGRSYVILAFLLPVFLVLIAFLLKLLFAQYKLLWSHF